MSMTRTAQQRTLLPSLLSGRQGLFDNRTYFDTTFNKRPLLAADILITSGAPTLAQMALIEQANDTLEVKAGTNATSALCTFSDGGGITLTTATASADQEYIGTRVASNQSGPANWKWNTNDELAMYCRIKTGASIASVRIFCGFFLTIAAPFAETTDADAVFVTFNDSVNSGKWQGNLNASNTDYTADLGVAVAASTTYDMEFHLDRDRKVHFFINGDEKGYISTAATANIDLLPFVGVETRAAAAKAITLRRWVFGKKDND